MSLVRRPAYDHMMRHPPVLSPADLLMTLAVWCGIGPEVSELLAERNLAPGPSLADLLRNTRKGRGETVAAVARRCAMSRATLFSFEVRKQLPNLRTIIVLARGYEIPLALVLQAALRDKELLRPSQPELPATPRNRVKRIV